MWRHSHTQMKTALLLLCVPALAAAQSTATVQHRGIWMHPEQFKTPQLAEESIGRIASAHLNAIYPLGWHRGGTAWFNGKLRTCPRASIRWATS